MTGQSFISLGFVFKPYQGEGKKKKKKSSEEADFSLGEYSRFIMQRLQPDLHTEACNYQLRVFDTSIWQAAV